MTSAKPATRISSAHTSGSCGRKRSRRARKIRQRLAQGGHRCSDHEVAVRRPPARDKHAARRANDAMELGEPTRTISEHEPTEHRDDGVELGVVEPELLAVHHVRLDIRDPVSVEPVRSCAIILSAKSIATTRATRGASLQTGYADFPHTAYQWSLVEPHYASRTASRSRPGGRRAVGS